VAEAFHRNAETAARETAAPIKELED